MLHNIIVAVVRSLSRVQLNIMVILIQIWISDNHPNIHDPEPTTPTHSPVLSDPTPLLETGSPAPKTWRELISGDQVLQDIYFQGWVGSGLGMEADTSPSGLAKRILFLLLNLYTVKASPQDQRVAVEKKKSLGSRWSVGVGKRLAGKTDKREQERGKETQERRGTWREEGKDGQGRKEQKEQVGVCVQKGQK